MFTTSLFELWRNGALGSKRLLRFAPVKTIYNGLTGKQGQLAVSVPIPETINVTEFKAMNENEILYAAHLWIAEKLTSILSYSCSIYDKGLRIDLTLKYRTMGSFIKSDIILYRATLDKMISNYPVFFTIDGEPVSECFFNRNKKISVVSRSYNGKELDTYLTSLTPDELCIPYHIQARMKIKIILKNYPENEALKLAIALLKDFENGHLALACFSEIQIDYRCGGRLISDRLKRKSQP